MKCKKFLDERGYFQEIFRNDNLEFPVGQVNLSKSHKNVLRGLHIASYPKLCTCIRGRLWDVYVDLRPESKTFKQWFSCELSEENHEQFLIPADCAHGFLSLEDDSCLLYLQGDVWKPEDDRGLRWNDPEINIQWPSGDYIISEKDQIQPFLCDL